MLRTCVSNVKCDGLDMIKLSIRVLSCCDQDGGHTNHGTHMEHWVSTQIKAREKTWMRSACRRLDGNGSLGRNVVAWHKAETSYHSQEYLVWCSQNLFSKVSLTSFKIKLLPMLAVHTAGVSFQQVSWSCR